MTDIAAARHACVVIDAEGHRLLSRADVLRLSSDRGEGKTDARDAAVIAGQAAPGRKHDGAELLTAHRSDLVADRTRTVNRIRDLLTGYQTPAWTRSSEPSSWPAVGITDFTGNCDSSDGTTKF